MIAIYITYHFSLSDQQTFLMNVEYVMYNSLKILPPLKDVISKVNAGVVMIFGDQFYIFLIRVDTYRAKFALRKL